MTGFRILFVSAGQDSFHAVTKVLEATNHAVNHVATGKQAVSAAGSTNPSLILTDINLPDMTGYELIKALRDDGDTAIIPIIVVSSVASEDAIVMALDIGADDYVTIPFGRRELLARIKAVHRRSTISVITMPTLALIWILVVPSPTQRRTSRTTWPARCRAHSLSGTLFI